jgi:hypothetical protein
MARDGRQLSPVVAFKKGYGLHRLAGGPTNLAESRQTVRPSFSLIYERKRSPAAKIIEP